MTENELLILIISILQGGLNSLFPSAEIVQSYQPVNHGVPQGPTVYLYKVGDRPYGYPGIRSIYNAVDDDFDQNEAEFVDATFQVSAQNYGDITDVSRLSAMDLCNTSRGIMQSRATIKTLVANGIGLLRASQTRTVRIINDDGRHEDYPSFDFTVNYIRPIVSNKVASITTFNDFIRKVP